MEQEITFADAAKMGKYVKLVKGQEKQITCTNWGLRSTDKFGETTIEFYCDVIKEDGKDCEDKIFNNSSKRLRVLLEPIFTGQPKNAVITLSITMAGEQFATQYVVRQLTGGATAPSPSPTVAAVIAAPIEMPKMKASVAGFNVLSKEQKETLNGLATLLAEGSLSQSGYDRAKEQIMKQ